MSDGMAHRADASGRQPPWSLAYLPGVLVATTWLLQSAAWLASDRVSETPAARIGLAAAEMGLLLLLLLNGWRIRRFLAMRDASPRALCVATLVLASLGLCILGDAVNRNFAGRTFAYDDVIEHSYLADSVWFFFPGYLLFIVAAWHACRPRLPGWIVSSSIAAACLAGAASFARLAPHEASIYVLATTGGYALLIPNMVSAALWIGLSFGRIAWLVALGSVLSTLADALIAQFWLFGHGHFPGIAHLNFSIYFLSQALLQRFPLVVGEADRNAPRPRL